MPFTNDPLPFSSETTSFVNHLADAQTAERAALAELLHRLNGKPHVGRGLGGQGWHKPGDGLAVFGDGELFSLSRSLQELGQVGFGLERTDGFHNPPYAISTG